MRVKGFLPKRPFLCRINAAVAIDQKCHQADRKKCKPIFHTKYFHSDQNRCAKYWLHFPPPRIQVPQPANRPTAIVRARNPLSNRLFIFHSPFQFVHFLQFIGVVFCLVYVMYHVFPLRFNRFLNKYYKVVCLWLFF